MKVHALILTIFMAAAVAAGQVTTAADDISAERYFAAEKKAAELLKTATYRSVWTKEYVYDPTNVAELEERKLKEVLQPNKWRTVEELFIAIPGRKENIFDGKVYYNRMNDEPWTKGSSAYGLGSRIVNDQDSRQYRYLLAVDLEGQNAEYYEMISVEKSKPKFDEAGTKSPWVHTTRIWYSFDGRVLKKVIGTAREGEVDMFRETTTYEYNPKDLKIEAPIK